LSGQDEEVNVPPPVENVTDPTGVVAPANPSVTVAVQEAAWLTATEVGVQDTDVVVGEFATT